MLYSKCDDFNCIIKGIPIQNKTILIIINWFYIRFEYFSKPVHEKGVVDPFIITESDNAFILKVILSYLLILLYFEYNE